MSGAADRLEIIELLNRHQIYIDLADAEGYAGLYAPDGAYESPCQRAPDRIRHRYVQRRAAEGRWRVGNRQACSVDGLRKGGRRALGIWYLGLRTRRPDHLRDSTSTRGV